MTTTNRRGRSPRVRPNALRNLRFHLASALAATYLLSWWAFGFRTSGSTAAIANTPMAPRPTVLSRRAVWYGDLPPSQRLPVTLPPGWRIANATDGIAAPEPLPVPVEVRVAPSRTRRVRTRSS